MVSEKQIAGVMLFFLSLQLIFGVIFIGSMYRSTLGGVENQTGLAITGAVGFLALGLVNWALGYTIFPEED